MSIFKERTNYKPYEYGDITTPLIESMHNSHWTHNEFSFVSDVQDFHTKLTSEEREIIKRTMLVISQVEVAVKSYWSNIGKLLPKPEISDMGATFGGVEVIHSMAYSEILEILGLNDAFTDLLDNEVIKQRVEYLSKYNKKVYDNDKKQIAYSLALFSLFTENISLFSQFFIVLGFNKFRGIMKDIANVVQYTSKEENIHALGGIALINVIRKEEGNLFDDDFKNKLIEEAQVALNAERRIISWILKGYENEFVSEEILYNFISNRMNEAFEKIGVDYKFDVDIDTIHKSYWMEEEIFAEARTDFFNKRPIDYAKKDMVFSADDLF